MSHHLVACCSLPSVFNVCACLRLTCEFRRGREQLMKNFGGKHLEFFISTQHRKLQSSIGLVGNPTIGDSIQNISTTKQVNQQCSIISKLLFNLIPGLIRDPGVCGSGGGRLRAHQFRHRHVGRRRHLLRSVSPIEEFFL